MSVCSSVIRFVLIMLCSWQFLARVCAIDTRYAPVSLHFHFLHVNVYQRNKWCKKHRKKWRKLYTNKQTNKQTKQHTKCQVSKQVFDEYSLMYLCIYGWILLLKELKHRKLGWKVLILKYDLGKSLSKEMWCKMADPKKIDYIF